MPTANKKILLTLSIAMLPLLLSGCVLFAATAIGTGASVAHDRRTAGVFIEDQAIELKAIKAIFDDKELYKNSHINVTSYKKDILLTGETPTEALSQRAVDLVKDIAEVGHVYNELEIAAPSSLISRSSDTLITGKLKSKLLLLKDFDGTRVKIITERGIVYLLGLINREEGQRATEVAQATGGVQKVIKLFQYID